MIDQHEFRNQWTLLTERFGRDPGDAVAAAYYEILSSEMDTESFRAASRHVFRHREFFPRPIDFIDATRPDIEAEALEQWELAPAATHDAGARSRLTKEARRVVDLLGGFDVFRQTSPDKLSHVRREFMQLYGKAAEVARREASRQLEATPDAKRIAETVGT